MRAARQQTLRRLDLVVGMADSDGVGAERERLEDVGSPPEAAIDKDGDSAGDGARLFPRSGA